MKKTFYLFNSGRLSRTDNTLKFENEKEHKYIPIEAVDEFYVFGSLDVELKLR